MKQLAQHNVNSATATTPTPRLYLRPNETADMIGVSRRCLSNWQKRRVIPFRRVGRTVLFSITDITAALDKFRVAAVGERKTNPRL